MRIFYKEIDRIYYDTKTKIIVLEFYAQSKLTFC